MKAAARSQRSLWTIFESCREGLDVVSGIGGRTGNGGLPAANDIVNGKVTFSQLPRATQALQPTESTSPTSPSAAIVSLCHKVRNQVEVRYG
jgi:hypothetical protein